MQRLPLRRNAAEEGGCLIKRKPNKKKKKERRKAKRRKGRRKQRVNRGRKGGWIREPLAGWDSIPRNGRIWLANSRKRKPTGVAGGLEPRLRACVLTRRLQMGLREHPALQTPLLSPVSPTTNWQLTELIQRGHVRRLRPTRNRTSFSTPLTSFSRIRDVTENLYVHASIYARVYACDP